MQPLNRVFKAVSRDLLGGNAWLRLGETYRVDLTQSTSVSGVRSLTGNPLQNLDHADALLRSPRSDTSINIYEDISVIEHTHMESPNCQDLLSYMAFAATCVETHASTISNHHLNHMVFATTVMDGTALVASSQQICNADGILLEPLSLSEAKARDDWNKWYEAMVTEMASMTKMDVFELADIPTDDKLIGVCWVFKLKLDGQQRATWYKACLVTQGYAQHQGLDYNQTFSPVVHLQAIYMLLTLAHQYSLYVIQLDINTVFLNGRIDKDVYVWIPPLFEAKVTEGKCYKLKKALYSLKQAGHLWHTALDKQLQAFGFQ